MRWTELLHFSNEGYVRRGPYGEPISRFWQDTYVPWAVTNNLVDCPRYGIDYDDPGITAPESCRYDACAEVAADFVATGGAFKTTIPGGRYAVLAFKGSAADVVEGWTILLRDWWSPSTAWRVMSSLGQGAWRSDERHQGARQDARPQPGTCRRALAHGRVRGAHAGVIRRRSGPAHADADGQ